MTPGGWFLMILATGSVTILLTACIVKVLITPESTEHIHNPMTEETPDMRDENL
ncbi:MAG: hypothetical protein FWH27_09915 [Planctomycetaceae bacterium]|nr:hypothetical protein [Planctomycetaceae bacterium]